MGEYAQKLSSLHNKANMHFKSLENGSQKQYQGGNFLGNRSLPNDYIPSIHQSSRSYGTNPTRIPSRLSPFQAVGDSIANGKNENTNFSNGKVTQMNNSQGVGNSVTSVTTLASSTINAANNTNTANNTSISNSFSISNTMASKSIRPEYLRPDEKEKRRLTYQVPINKSVTYKVLFAASAPLIVLAIGFHRRGQ